jgi:hypothetical protein
MPKPPPGSPRPWSDGTTAVYHITHVDNIASIAQRGIILCDRACSDGAMRPVSIAYADLKSRRTWWPVRVARGGTLADYVPFYFAPRSPMLFVISRGAVAGYDEGQAEVAPLVLAAEALAVPRGFAITDGHAATPLTTQYAGLEHLDKVCWPIMYERYWSDTDEDGDRKRHRQAEFLVWRSVPFEQVRMIGVMTATIAERVRAALAGSTHAPHIVVRPDRYH